jgi:hypothetical protein
MPLTSESAPDSVYRQIQRFLENENEVSIDFLKLLKINGKLKGLTGRNGNSATKAVSIL